MLPSFLPFLYRYSPQHPPDSKRLSQWFGSNPSQSQNPYLTNKEACWNASSGCGFSYTASCPPPRNKEGIVWERNVENLQNLKNLKNLDDFQNLEYLIPVQSTSCWNCLGNPNASVECDALDPSFFILPQSPDSLYQIRITNDPNQFIIIYDSSSFVYSVAEWEHLKSLFASKIQSTVYSTEFKFNGKIGTSKQSLFLYGVDLCKKNSKEKDSSRFFDTSNSEYHRQCQLFYEELTPFQQNEVMQEVCRLSKQKECKCVHRHDEKDYQLWEHAVPNSRDAQCWYQPCTDSSRYFIPSSLRSTENCPKYSCQNIVLAGDHGKNENNRVQQTVQCSFDNNDNNDNNNTTPPPQTSSFSFIPPQSYFNFMSLVLLIFIIFIIFLFFILLRRNKNDKNNKMRRKMK